MRGIGTLRNPREPQAVEVTAIRYRRDIDGLRAVAVAIVVAYHVGIPGFDGGFIGVDVFFVISGFLITTLLVHELRQRGSIDLLAFYARRARRLLPAFFLVLAVTLLLGAFVLLPIGGEQQGLASSAKAAALYFSNLYFARTTGGYFDNSSEFMPLLHTWSLAVEEQFYFIWPLLLIACSWAARHRKWHVTAVIMAVLAIVFAISLTHSYLASEAGGRAARFAFFALPSRAWELALGAALALAIPFISGSRTWLGAAAVSAGLLAIAVTVVLFREGMPFPGIAALLPTLGAAAIIAGGSVAPQSPVPRLLSTRLFVGIGLLSYTWYLWHWPLLAIVRARDLGAQDVWRDGATALVALGLAWLTYVWVEHPIRSRKILTDWSKARVLGASAAASLVLIAGAHGLWTHAGQLSKSDRYQRLSRASDDKTWSSARCHHKNGKCMQAAGVAYRGFVVLWGDSHADHLAGTVQPAIAPHGLALLSRDMGGCPPVTNAVVFAGMRRYEKCARFNAEVLAEIVSASGRGELAAVVLSARWPLYLGRPKLSGQASPAFVALPGQQPSVDHAPTALHHGVKATVIALLERGIKVLVIASVPEHRYDVVKCLARKSLELCSVGREEAEHHRGVALHELKAVFHDAQQARLWDPFMPLCGKERCLVERDGIILYHDDNHLTYRGSRWLAAHFEEMAAWLASERASSSRHGFMRLGAK